MPSNCLVYLCLSYLLVLNCISVQVLEWNVDISTANSYNFSFWWNKCVGSGHASLALRSDWREHLKLVHDEIGFEYVRMHGILDDDIGVVNGVNQYSFVNIDKIYDYLVSINMKPYVEISFMPQSFASGSYTKFHYNANITPPSSWSVWYDFIKQWISHLVDRYGIQEVSSWYFEVWNEPNCGFYYEPNCCGCSCSSPTEYLSLYMNTSRAIKSVSSKIKVGGPSTSGLCWLSDFLTNTSSLNIPVDFLSSHQYPNTAQVNKYGVNWYFNQLNAVNNDINKFGDKYKNLTFILSEYNSGISYNNIPYDNHDNNFASSFMIAMMYRLQNLLITSKDNGHFDFMSYWTFDDIFEEQGFWSSPFWSNPNTTKNTYFGMITKRGILKPVFVAMQLVTKYGSNISYPSVLMNGDINDNDNTVILFCLENNFENSKDRYSIFISNWNYYGSAIKNETVKINLTNQIKIPPKSATIYRIDADNANPWEIWNNMNKPIYPTQQQLNELNQSTELKPVKAHWSVINATTIQFDQIIVPIYGVVMIDVQY